MKYTIPLNVILLSALTLISLCSCERGEGKAHGHMRVAFESEEAALAAFNNGPFTIEDKGTKFHCSPRQNPHNNKHVTSYDIEVTNWSSMKLKTEQQLLKLITPKVSKMKPVEIYSLQVPGLSHSERTYAEVADLAAFFEYFHQSRPFPDYSLAEVRSVLPQAHRETFDKQAIGKSFKIVFDWKPDERDLVVNFDHNNDQNMVFLKGIGLTYTPGE